MSHHTFQISFSGGPAEAHYRCLSGEWDTRFAAGSVQSSANTQQAADQWLANAYNEHHSATIMSTLAQALTAAQTPLDLAAMACGFAGQELLHAELCARLALYLSPTPVLRSEKQILLDDDPDLTPQQKAHDAVLRLCCIGETFSFGWLKAMRATTHNPIVLMVIKRLLKDEALHSRFGWLYFDWAQNDLTPTERNRLAQVAARTLAGYDAILNPPANVADATEERYGILDVHSQARVGRTTRDNVILPRMKAMFDG